MFIIVYLVLFFVINYIVKRKFKQYWSTIQPISTKQTTASNHWTQKQKETTTYGTENTGLGLGQAHRCGGVKLSNGW